MAEILALARSAATQLTADRFGKPVRLAWVTQARVNVNGPSDSNIARYHAGSFWSGTYCVADGACAADPPPGGAFKMIEPRGPVPAIHAPTLRFAGEDGQSTGSGETILPKPSLLFLFPSWLQHQVRSYRGTELRISITLNLGV